MHELVAEDVVVLGQVAGQRHDHAVHEGIGEAARALADQLRRRGGLVEVGRVRVEHDRLARESVVEDVGEPHVPALGHPSHVVHHVRLAVVVVDVEVLRLQDLEVEVLPLDFVLAEVLRSCGARDEDEEEGCKEEFAHCVHLD